MEKLEANIYIYIYYGTHQGPKLLYKKIIRCRTSSARRPEDVVSPHVMSMPDLRSFTLGPCGVAVGCGAPESFRFSSGLCPRTDLGT